MISNISFCVTTYNSEQYITLLINGLVEAADYAKIDYEIIVVDNNSGDSTTSIIKNFPNIILINNKDNENVSRSRNLALKVANYKYCWFFDDDSLINKELVNKAIPIIEGSNADLLMPLVMNSNGVPLNCNKRLNNKIDYNLQPREIILDFSSCFIINVECIKNNSLYFDEDIRFMWEDVEYFFRLKRNGIKFIYTFSLPIKHRVKEINNHMGRRFYLQTKNAIILYRKLNKVERKEFNNYCPGGNFFTFMLLSFITALLNYNFWADFYNPKVTSYFDRVKSVFNSNRITLDRSNMVTLNYYFNGILKGLLYNSND